MEILLLTNTWWHVGILNQVSKSYQQSNLKKIQIFCISLSGEIILKEEPFFIAPKQVDGPAICLGCCCLLDGRAVNCPKCTWPMCGKSECWEEGSHHALGECGPLQDAGSRVTDDYSSRVPNGVYQSILILRCLPLSARDPSSWSKMMDLKYCDPIKCLNGVDIDVVVKLVKQWLPQVPLDLVIKVLGIFFLNAFKLPAIDEIQSEGLLVSILIMSYLYIFLIVLSFFL